MDFKAQVQASGLAAGGNPYFGYRAQIEPATGCRGPRVGTAAPNFLPEQLEQFMPQQKPTALIIGSYACPVVKANMPTISHLQTKYGQHVQFVFVQVHRLSSDGPRGAKASYPAEGYGSTFSETTISHRAIFHGFVRAALGLSPSFRMVVDSEDQAIQSSYAAWPNRQFVIGSDGSVQYQGPPAPYGLDPLELELAIRGVCSSAGLVPR